MDKNTLKSSIKAYCLELMNEINSLGGGGEGAYLTKQAGRKLKKQDITSPTGFESSPKNNYYPKFKFRLVKPTNKNSKQLWKEIKINNPNKNSVFPIKVNNEEELERQVKKLIQKGFKPNWNYYNGGYPVNIFGDTDGWLFLEKSDHKRYNINLSDLQEKLHKHIKEINMKLDEVNNLDQYLYKIEGKQDKEINELKNSLLKIQSKLKKSLNEIKVNNPTKYLFSLNNLIDLYFKIYYKIENIDLNDILEKYIPENIMNNQKLNYDDMLKISNEDIQRKIYQEFLQIAKQEKLIEGKQVGDLYHFTPVKSFLNMLKTQHIFPNQENQISTTRKTSIDHTSFNDNPPNSPMVRITFDGNKISTKYKIKPYNWDFSTDGGISDEEYKQWGVKDSVAEEQIVVNGNLFPFLPYVKRIDIFNNKNKNIPHINNIEKKLKELNIPIKIYYDQTSINNIGFNQDKTGDTSNIKLPKPIKIYKDVDLYFNIPKSNGYEIELNINKDLGINANYRFKLGYSTLYPNYYYKYLYNKNDIENYFNFKGLEYKIIENPNIDYIRNDKEFKEKLKYSESPMLGYPRSYDYPYIALLNKDFIDKHTKYKKQIK